MYHKTYIEINKKNIEHNLNIITSNYPEYEYFIGIVKGNAYGHGYEIIPTLEKSGINYFAVSSLEEALEVRKFTQLPILCLQPLHIEEIATCTSNNITITISNLDLAKQIANLDLLEKLKVHIKVDSGLNRLGFKNDNELEEAISILQENKNILLEGIYSHFATTGVFDSYWDKQLFNFQIITNNTDLNIFKIHHLGRSLTLINHPKIPFCNAVRVGILMYGINQSPSKKKQSSLKRFIKKIFYRDSEFSKTTTDHDYNFKTAFSLKSEVVEIKKVKRGDRIGYGAFHIAPSDGYIAIVPIGYADGFSKRNKGSEVFINNKRYKIVSEVNMGMLTIFVDENVKVGDAVELIGQNITLQEVARRTGTSVYETLCALQNTIPRILK